MEKEAFMASQLLDQWEEKVSEITYIFLELGTARAYEAVALGKNRVIYLLGHLTTVHDFMLEALELEERKLIHYDDLFLLPQHPANEYPPFEILIEQWQSVNDKLIFYFRHFTIDEWKSKHHFVNDKEFSIYSKKNKFSIFISSLSHLSQHVGQLAMIRL